MEPQETNYCCISNQSENRNCCCLERIMSIMVTLCLTAIGLILGAVFATTLIDNIAVVILGTVFLLLGVFLTMVLKRCMCNQ